MGRGGGAKKFSLQKVVQTLVGKPIPSKNFICVTSQSKIIEHIECYECAMNHKPEGLRGGTADADPRGCMSDFD